MTEKKIGVAIYPTKNEKIGEIFNKVLNYPDFIHIDIVDKSFYPEASAPKKKYIYEIEALWPKKLKMAHIMSKNPQEWIKLVHDHVDWIIFHCEIDIPIESIINLFKHEKKDIRFGISLFYYTPITKILPFIELIDVVQVLGIPKPGYSGQIMDPRAIDVLNGLTGLKKYYHFVTCFDGGVNLENIHSIHADFIVSGSAIINSANPPETIEKMKSL